MMRRGVKMYGVTAGDGGTRWCQLEPGKSARPGWVGKIPAKKTGDALAGLVQPPLANPWDNALGMCLR